MPSGRGRHCTAEQKRRAPDDSQRGRTPPQPAQRARPHRAPAAPKRWSALSGLPAGHLFGGALTASSSVSSTTSGAGSTCAQQVLRGQVLSSRCRHRGWCCTATRLFHNCDPVGFGMHRTQRTAHSALPHTTPHYTTIKSTHTHAHTTHHTQSTHAHARRARTCTGTPHSTHHTNHVTRTHRAPSGSGADRLHRRQQRAQVQRLLPHPRTRHVAEVRPVGVCKAAFLSSDAGRGGWRFAGDFTVNRVRPPGPQFNLSAWVLWMRRCANLKFRVTRWSAR